jgi:predicted CoA-binding protein
MAKLSRAFFTDNEILFMGYSSSTQAFSKSIYKAFSDAGVKVYPVNPKKSDVYEVKVYNDISELPKVPTTAYILMNNKDVKDTVRTLKDKGIKKILFQPGKTADKEILDDCAASGIEAVVGCPMMVFGKGMHRFHGFLAGVKR